MHKFLFPAVCALALMACAPPYSSSESASGTSPESASAPAAGATPAPAPVVAVAPGDLDALKAHLTKVLPGVPVDAVRATPIPGIFEVQSGMMFGYVSQDGRYLIEGDLNDIGAGKRLTEDRRRDARMALIHQFDEGRSILYAPEGPTKYTVTVFTDIDCGYCRKLHSHIAEYNADGIAVRYLFFPRSGPNTESFYKAEKVWCAQDRKAALTEAKLGSGYDGDKSCQNPVMDHLRLASQLGLRGTPAIILPDGELVPGYQTPEQLLKALAEHAAPAAAG